MIIQDHKTSLFESITNTVVGYIVALISQIVIFPMYGISVSLETNLYIGLWFTLISIVRGFCLRRYFNWRSEIKLSKEVV